MTITAIIPKQASMLGVVITNDRFFLLAMRIAPNVIGRIQPLIAPAIISKLTGLPINKKTKVEITINVITIRLFY